MALIGSQVLSGSAAIGLAGCVVTTTGDIGAFAIATLARLRVTRTFAWAPIGIASAAILIKRVGKSATGLVANAPGQGTNNRLRVFLYRESIRVSRDGGSHVAVVAVLAVLAVKIAMPS